MKFRAKIFRRNRSGIAMVTVIMILVFMMIITGMVLRILVQGSKVTGSARRYYTTFEAAESGVDVGMLNIEAGAAAGTLPDTAPFTIGSKTVGLTIEQIFTGYVAGANITFGGTGYEGVGTGISSGGTAIHYRIESRARGSYSGFNANKERVTLESVYRKIVGIAAR